MAISPIAHVVNEIKKADLTDAALYWFAYNFINQKCKHDGQTCKNFPPNGVCNVADCVHRFMKDKLGIDIPMIQPKHKEVHNGSGKSEEQNKD